MLRISTCCLLTLFAVVSQVAGDDSDGLNYFINPPTPGPKFSFDHNNVWSVGTPVTLTWATTYDKLSLFLWQYGNGTKQTVLDSVEPRTSWDWRVNLEGLYSVANGNGTYILAVSLHCRPMAQERMLIHGPSVVFFFQINDESANASDTLTKDSFGSHYINITDPGVSTSSTSSASSSTAPTSTSSTSSAAESGSSSSSGLSTGAKIGIGAGVGGGVLLLTAGGAFFFFRRRINKSRQPQNDLKYSNSMNRGPWSWGGMQQVNTMSPHYGYPHQNYPGSPMARSPQELPNDNGITELGAVRGWQERQELPGDVDAPNKYGSIRRG